MAAEGLSFAQQGDDSHALSWCRHEAGIDVVFDLRPARRQGPVGERQFHEWTFPDGTLWTQFYRTLDGYLIRFPDLADFTLSADGKEVAAYPTTEVTVETVCHLYLNQVVPLALGRQFKLVLHASAVELGALGAAFLGLSGRGKPTLAASFARSGRRFLTDDGLQLEKGEDGYLIQPSLPSIRLWDDSRYAVMPKTARLAPSVGYTPKARLLADSDTYCDAPRPLSCIYFLGEGSTDTISIAPVSGRDAMIELVRHSFLLDIEEKEMLKHHFTQLVELANLPMFFRLDYPRRYDMLPQVREAVVRHATALR